MSDENINLAICTPIPSETITLPNGKQLEKLQNVTVQWHRSRQSMVPPFCVGFRELAVDGYEVGVARCMAAKRALETKCDYLAFLDWDVLCPPGWLHTLVTHAKNNPAIDVFSGVYCAKMCPPHPLIYKNFKGQGVFWDWKPGDVLTKGITGVGMGCAVIRCSVFNRLRQTKTNPWFKTIKELDTKNHRWNRMTEDLWFCKRLCDEIGPNRIMVDTSIICSHIANNTGIQYVLPENSIPGRALKKLLAK